MGDYGEPGIHKQPEQTTGTIVNEPTNRRRGRKREGIRIDVNDNRERARIRRAIKHETNALTSEKKVLKESSPLA